MRTAPFDDTTRFSSIVTPGSDFGSEPVARITARLASSVSVPDAPFTSTVPLPARFAYQRSSSGLMVRSEPATSIQLGLLRHAGTVITPLKFSALFSTCDRAMKAGLADSRNAAKRQISGGGLRLNDEPQAADRLVEPAELPALLSLGKRKVRLIAG